MVPSADWVGIGEVDMPPGMSTVIPEHEDWSVTDDIFGFDFSNAFEQVIDGHVSNGVGFEIDDQPQPLYSATAGASPGDARQRHQIFQKSPWYTGRNPLHCQVFVLTRSRLWNPSSKSHAFSEHNQIQVDYDEISSTASPHHSHAATLEIPDELSSETRDRIFRLVVMTADARISVPTFPSTVILDTLVKVGIVKRLETDAWIHPYTFASEQTRPELLIALVAAGCVCFGVPKVNRTGLVLLEIARVALNKLIEDDNSTIRDLQYLQASMIWLDICGFCGYRRKMEIAESNLQPIVTVLRRCGKFDRVAYEDIIPSPEDDINMTTSKWRRWVKQESYKRLVFHVFEHDMLMSMAKHRQPVLSYAELTLPLPASRKLWLAPSAEAWRTAYIQQIRPEEIRDASMRSLLADSRPISCLPRSFDDALATTALLYGISAQVWEHVQHSALKNDGVDSDPSHQLWMQSRHQALYQKLKTLAESVEGSPQTTHLALHFQMMSLHVSVDTVMRFAGKCGESEAHRAYQKLQTWTKEKSARIAIWYVQHSISSSPLKSSLQWDISHVAFLEIFCLLTVTAYDPLTSLMQLLTTN